MDVKLTKCLTLTIHTAIIWDKVMNYNFTNLIFDFVGQISNECMIMPNECYTTKI